MNFIFIFDKHLNYEIYPFERFSFYVYQLPIYRTVRQGKVREGDSTRTTVIF
ncbi:Hypothetical protein ABZS17I87_03061 [Kosakonia cowanii]